MDFFGSFAIAFSMYSKIPMPQVEWTKKRMAYALCFFPLIGVVLGGGLYGVCGVLGWLEFDWAIPFGAVVLPLAVTGGIHMDGFLDVTDARSSLRDREKKLEILKDPHTGAFAIIGFGCYVLLYLGAFFCLPERLLPAFCTVFVTERALSGLSVVAFPMAKNTGLASTFSSQAEKKAVVTAMALYLLAVTAFLIRWYGYPIFLLTAVAGGLAFGYYYRMSVKEFGGITGDLAGYFLQICELAVLCGLVLGSRFV